MGAFFVWNVGFCLVLGKLANALWIATLCKVAWPFVNIKTPVYTDVCELSVKGLHCLISLLMYSVHLPARPYHMMPTHLMTHPIWRI